MSDRDIFEKDVQKALEWNRDICAAIGTDDPRRGWSVMRSVLHCLRDRLTVDEATDLAAQLPTLVRGAYYEGFRPPKNPDKSIDRGAFIAELEGKFGESIDAESAVRGVLLALAGHVTAGEIEDVKGMLPRDLRELWPQAAATR